MIWIALLIVMLLIACNGMYRKLGESYSAGRGMFRSGGYDLDDSHKDFSDYDPWDYKGMRK